MVCGISINGIVRLICRELISMSSFHTARMISSRCIINRAILPLVRDNPFYQFITVNRLRRADRSFAPFGWDASEIAGSLPQELLSGRRRMGSESRPVRWSVRNVPVLGPVGQVFGSSAAASPARRRSPQRINHVRRGAPGFAAVLLAGFAAGTRRGLAARPLSPARLTRIFISAPE